MDKCNYQYFLHLMDHSIQNTFILQLFILFEFMPLFVYYFELPVKVMNFLNENNAYQGPFLSCLSKFSFYYFFRLQIISESTDNYHYPLYIRVLIPIFIFLFICYFILAGMFSVKCVNSSSSVPSSQTCCSSIIKYTHYIFIFLYDHLFFRIFSLCVIDCFINYIINGASYHIIPTIALFFVLLYIQYKYYSLFRICVKIDKNHQYSFNDSYALDIDYMLFLIKLLITFEVNYTQYNQGKLNNCALVFITLNLMILLYLLIKFWMSNMIYRTDCSKGIWIMILMLTTLSGFLFPLTRTSWVIFIFFVIFIVILPVTFTIFLRKAKFHSIVSSKKEYRNKLLLVFEYYQSEHFDIVMNKIYFYEQKHLLSLDKEDKKLSLYLKYLAKNLHKETCASSQVYYVITKLFLAIHNHKNNTFKFIFTIRKIILKLQLSYPAYYLNMKMLFLHMQNEIHKGNIDFYILNNSYSLLYKLLNDYITAFNDFVEKEHVNTAEDYLTFATYINEVDQNAKMNYNSLENERTEEYQKILFRIIIEAIKNKPIKNQYSHLDDLFIREEVVNYEEFLEKQYFSDNLIKLKLTFTRMKCHIMKIGKNLNSFYCKDFFKLFDKKYRNIARDYFFQIIPYEFNQKYSKKKIEANASGYEYFQFIIKDEKNVFKELFLLYKIYPNMGEDLLYIDGMYTINNEDFLITETYYKNDKLIYISDNLSKIMLIDQQYLIVLTKYQLKLFLDMLIEETDNIFSKEKLVTLLEIQMKELLSICTQKEHNILTENIIRIKEAKKAISYKIKLELKYTYKDKEKDTHYIIYRVLSSKKKKQTNDGTIENYGDTIFGNINTTNINNNENEPINSQSPKINTLAVTSFETGSVASTSSNKMFQLRNSLSQKRKNDQLKTTASHRIVFILHSIIILISIIFLIIENAENNDVSANLNLFQSIIRLNRQILNTMISFFSLLCYTNNDSLDNNVVCSSRFHHYLNPLGLDSLEKFAEEELLIKLDAINVLWKDYLKQSNNVKNETIQMLLLRPVNDTHLKYSNGKFQDLSQVTTTEDAFSQFLNQMTMIANTKGWNRLNIYPIYITEDFLPICFSSDNISLSSLQLNIYEIMFRYYDYSIRLFQIQSLVFDNTSRKISDTKNGLIIFIVALILLDFLLAFICIIIFNRSNLTIKNILKKMDVDFKNEENLEKIKTKIYILKDMIRLYHINPIELTNKLKETYKRIPTPTLTIKEKEDIKININQTLNLSHKDTKFVTEDFFIKLLMIVLFFLVYSLSFLGVFIMSFHQLTTCLKIMSSSGFVEEITYLSVSSLQMMEYSNLSDTALAKKFMLGADPQSMQYYETLFTYVETNIQEEKNQKHQLAAQNNSLFLFQYDCDTLLDIINDSRFNIIFHNHPEMNYTLQLSSFCTQISVLQYSDEKKFLNEINYNNMKLLGKFANNSMTLDLISNINDLYYLISEIIFIFRPLRGYLSNYYIEKVPIIVTSHHFIYLICFLIGNILVQVIDILILRFRIMKMIEKKIINLKDLWNVLVLGK